MNLTCHTETNSCAYLMTIEKKGTAWGTDGTTLFGAWTSNDFNSDVTASYSTKSSGNVFTGARKRFYQLSWQAPYLAKGSLAARAALQFRVDTVQFTGFTTCAIYYYEVDFPARVVCGDGFQDALEYCDDGNTVSGDGCDASCAIEPGYYCSPDNTGRSVCIKADLQLLNVDLAPLTAVTAADNFVEGSIYSYFIALTTPVAAGKQVIVSVFPAVNATGNLTVSGNNQVIFTEFDSQPKQFILQATNNAFADGQRHFLVRHSIQVTTGLDPAYAAVADKILPVDIVDDDVANVVITSNQPSDPGTPTVPKLVCDEGQGQEGTADYLVSMFLTCVSLPFIRLLNHFQLLRIQLAFDRCIFLQYCKITALINLLLRFFFLVFPTVRRTRPYGTITIIPQLVRYTLLGEPFNISITPSSLTFTQANFQLSQTFRLASAEDNDCTGDMPFTLNWRIQAPDTRDVFYKIYNIDQFSVDITVKDNDTPAIFTNTTTLALYENVSPDFYRLTLNSRPRSAVRLSLGLSCQMPRGPPPPGFDPCTLVAEATSQNNHAFAVLDRSNWNTGVVMRISVVNNDYNDLERTGTIVHT